MSLPTTMSAIRITRHGGPEVLELAQVKVPSPQPGDVLIEVRSAALNNTDLWTREGAYGRPDDPEALSGWMGAIDFPRIPGADVCGRVVAAGEDVCPSLMGRRVVLDPAVFDTDDPNPHLTAVMGSEFDGGYAQYVSAPASRIHDVTDSPLTDDQLAALPIAYGTAFGMIERSRLQPGETALVSGASGGVGLALVQIALARGAKVVAISSGSKIDEVRTTGAHHVINRAGDITAQIQTCAPEGIDVVLDVVAGALVNPVLSLLRDSGRWVVAGALGGYNVTIDIRQLYLRNVELIGSTMHTPAQLTLLMDLARQGAIHPLIAATYPLAEAAQAQAQLALRAHVGKIVLHPNG